MVKKKLGETSYKETAFGIIPRSQLIPLEIEGIKKAWDFVLQNERNKKISITPSFIKRLHKVGFAWIFPDFGGKFRTIDVEVSSHKPPHYYLVPQLVEDLCMDIKERFKNLPSIEENIFFEELVELLASAHHRFLWIHPFQDYNGRIGRLLINLVLLKLGLPPIELKVETEKGRVQYIEALAAADKGDCSRIKDIVRTALEEAARTLK